SHRAAQLRRAGDHRDRHRGRLGRGPHLDSGGNPAGGAPASPAGAKREARMPRAPVKQRASTGEGLFGPGSVTWRIMPERVIWVPGSRALYLQALHPRVMRATWQNTSFADRSQAWGRFVRTADFV